MLKNLKQTYYMCGAALITGIIMTGDAHAQQKEVNDIAKNIVDNIESIPGLLSAISYLFGIVLAVLGMLKIKDHVENPSNTPLKDGAIRLATGGGLFALPIVYDSVETLVNAGETEFGQTNAQLDAASWNME